MMEGPTLTVDADEVRFMAAAVAPTVTTKGVSLMVSSGRGLSRPSVRGALSSPAPPRAWSELCPCPQMVDTFDVPVIASGVIMDGRDIAAELATRAEAVQTCTALVTTEEAGREDTSREASLATSEDQTRIIGAFSGGSPAASLKDVRSPMRDLKLPVRVYWCRSHVPTSAKPR